MWAAVEFDDVPGRVRAVSGPDARQTLVVWTTEGLYGVWFSRAATVLRMGSVADAERAFDPRRGVLEWKGVAFRMHGECGAAGMRFGGDAPTSTRLGEQLVYDAAGRLTGVESADGTRVPIADPPRVGKWSAAGFSPDGRYLIVADEWGVRIFRYVPPKGGIPNRNPVASSEQRALFAAICENPDDDTPRLVYADWVQEHGQPERGEFIRLQCEYARQLRAGDPAPDAERMTALLESHGDLWQAELPTIRGVKWSGFWRGFAGVTVNSGSTLARNATALWAATPLESVVLTKLDCNGAAALAKCPQLNRLRILELRGYSSFRDTCDPLRMLLGASGLANVWWLAFQGYGRLGAEAMEVLAGAGALKGLEVLTLRWCEIDNDGARALAASPHFPRIREVDLLGNELTDDTPSLLRKRFPRVLF